MIFHDISSQQQLTYCEVLLIVAFICSVFIQWRIYLLRSCILNVALKDTC